jgi:molybdenum cofactor biosynthesis enzyme MoaA
LDAALELGFGGAIGGAAETATTTTSSNNNSALPFSSAPFGSSTSSFASTSAAAPAGVKLNVVVVRGVNDDEVELFSALTRASPLNVRFIEYMPFDGNAWGKGKGMVPYAELRGRADLYAARTAAEEQAAAMAAAALPFPLPMAPAWPLACGSAGLGLSSSSSSSARGGVMSFAAAAYHRLAGGGDAFWEKEQQQQQQQERRRRALQGPIARFAAEAGAALPLTPPSPPPPSSPQQQQQQHRPFTADAPLLALRRLDDHPSEVAKNFRAPGHAGTLSFVTSMTSHFCGGCSRLRLLADGALKVCLFGASEVSLRDAARGGATDDDLLAVVGAAVRRKKASHAGMHEIARTSNRPMITIGG